MTGVRKRHIVTSSLHHLITLNRAVSDGGYSSEATPVPIPNTVVKLVCADGTAWATVWKSRSPPSPTALFVFYIYDIESTNVFLSMSYGVFLCRLERFLYYIIVEEKIVEE